MNMDQPGGADLGVKLSKSANAEVPSTSKFTTPQETSATSLNTHSRSTQDDSGEENWFFYVTADYTEMHTPYFQPNVNML